MEEKINEYINLVIEFKNLIATMNQGRDMFNDTEDGFILTTLRSLPTNEELDTFIFYLKEKLNRVNTKLYCIETDSSSEKGYTINEVKVSRTTDKLYKFSAYGMSQINKYSDLYVDKGDESTVRIFATDLEKGVATIKEAIQDRVQDIRRQLEQYNNTLAKVKLHEDIE